jgi:hypothetical protein
VHVAVASIIELENPFAQTVRQSPSCEPSSAHAAAHRLKAPKSDEQNVAMRASCGVPGAGGGPA